MHMFSKSLNFLGGHAARERHAVVSVGRQDGIVRTQGRKRSHGHRFLPDVEVTEAADAALTVGLGGAFLQSADSQHLAQELHERFLGKRRLRLGLGCFDGHGRCFLLDGHGCALSVRASCESGQDTAGLRC
jgi:hypothetical protein